MPIRSREDAAEVEALIGRVFGAPNPERPAAIRQVFAEALDFDPRAGTGQSRRRAHRYAVAQGCGSHRGA